MKHNRGWVLGIVVCLFLLSVGSQAHAATTIRWDLISISSFNPVTINPGGVASAIANDGTHISLIGTGTFVLEEPDKATGGGVWITRGPLGGVLSLGTYQVTGLIYFGEAPGRAAAPTVDNIGPLADQRGGVALLRITFSDGSTGVLTVMCRIPGPTGSGLLYSEGITVSKGAVEFWHPDHDIPGVDGNRTTFHVLP